MSKLAMSEPANHGEAYVRWKRAPPGAVGQRIEPSEILNIACFDSCLTTKSSDE